MTIPVELPYPPLVILAFEGPIRWSDIENQIRDRITTGVSICLVSASGEENRGGYFFHMKKTHEGYMFRTFDRDNVWSFTSPKECAEFINHVSGRQYSEDMWHYSQRINLRADPEVAGEPGRAPQG